MSQSDSTRQGAITRRLVLGVAGLVLVSGLAIVVYGSPWGASLFGLRSSATDHLKQLASAFHRAGLVAQRDGKDDWDPAWIADQNYLSPIAISELIDPAHPKDVQWQSGTPYHPTLLDRQGKAVAPRLAGSLARYGSLLVLSDGANPDPAEWRLVVLPNPLLPDAWVVVSTDTVARVIPVGDVPAAIIEQAALRTRRGAEPWPDLTTLPDRLGDVVRARR